MPFSDGSNIEWAKWLITELKPTTVVDVGPGAGKYGSIVRELLPDTKTTAVEIWEPYVETYGLRSIYDEVFITDARTFDDYSVDLVILGDVLEHMSREDALALWDKIRSQAKAAVISIPIIHFPQGHEHGNPYEEHVVDDWCHDSIMASFDGITGYRTFQVTGSYVAEFNKPHTQPETSL